MMLRLLIIFAFFFNAFSLLAQEYITSVKQYSLEDGLSHNQIHWIHKDSRGMMWIGAANGINRFDGKEFNLVAKANFFYSLNVKILEDHEGDLWLLCNADHPQLFFFNVYTETTKSLEDKLGTDFSFLKNTFHSADMLADSSIIIGTTTGKLIHYNANKSFNTITCGPAAKVWPIPIPQTNDFWIHLTSSSSGQQAENIVAEYNNFEVQRYSKTPNGMLTKLQTIPIAGKSLPLGVSKHQSLFIQNPNKTYSEIDLNGSVSTSKLPLITVYKRDFGTSKIIYAPDQQKLIQCKESKIHTFSTEGEELFISDYIKNLDISTYYSAFYDNEIVWLGGINGLLKIQIKQSPFRKIAYQNPRVSPPSKFKSFRRIDEYLRGQAPIFRDKDDHYTYYKDKNGREWLGRYYGIYYIDNETKQLKRFQQFNGHKAVLKSMPYCFYEDRDHQVWVLNGNGLFEFDINKGIIKRYCKEDPDHYLPVNDLRHIHQDSSGIYWIASSEGLIRWDKENKTHQLFTTADGLPNNHIMAVYEDDYGFLWMSSDNGIIQFEKKSAQVKVYLPEDGITHREFNRISHTKDDDGNIYFGGLNGITAFHPKDFVNRFHEVPNIPLVLTECHLFSNKNEKEENRIAQFQSQQKIIIQPGDQFLKLKFALLDYHTNDPRLIQYVYSVNGQEWNSGPENMIHINTLPYGQHTLTVKSRSGSGFFSKQTLSIPIEVLKPFYLQWWFLSFCFISILALLGLYQKIKTRSFLQRQAILEATVRERTKTIQEQSEALQELDKAKSRFLANISHEFRTPLTLILNTLNEEEVIKVTNYSQHAAKQNFSKTEVAIMHRNAQRLQQLIDQLLDLSKLESKNITLKETSGNFEFYLKELVASFAPLAQKEGIELTFSSNISTPQLYFDRDKIDKIIYNLLSNAIKFTPKNGHIKCTLSQASKNTFITVKDSGIGIPSSEQSAVFNRFYQINKANDYAHEGMGIGLALVQELVEAYNGRIQLESQPGEGSCFIISLPLQHSSTVISEVTDQQSLDYASHQSDSINHLKKETINLIGASPTTTSPIILFIEDNEDLLYYHQKAFADQYQLLLAKDGDSGLEMAFQHIPDLIVCDIMMPGKNGYEVCQALKTNEKTNHIPIILLTAKVGYEEKINGLTLGANDYMTKPYDPKELALRIANLLKQRQKKQHRFHYILNNNAEDVEVIGTEQAFVLKCQTLIEDQLTNRNFGVEQMSKEMGMSRNHLFRKVKSITGHTPTKFIRSYRLEKAKKLLLQQKGNATEISYLVGFNNPNYFFKCFKDEYGMTVGQFISEVV